ncbi:HNH endonuclease family protein [Pseudonocardia sp.]|uniref:HNH endonuclease family protein n=1 Tax=Pseudonocardia sp. TaxID=60912 RepID=UPI003D13B438
MHRIRAAATLLALAALLCGCGVVGEIVERLPDPGGLPPAAAGPAAEVLATLPVKGRAPRTGYARDEFGEAWADVDGDGCDQRNQILARDLVDERFVRGSRCLVHTGQLVDPYTGDVIAFRRGPTTSADVQIDHIVSLSNAWQTGAQRLTRHEREQLANDPLNLVATAGALNQGKGDGDAATWLPPATGYRCAFVARQVAVKARYRLWVTPAERDAILRVLGDCPGEPLPGPATRPLP